MPPKPADQNRKRGRPSNASKAADALPESPEVGEAEPNNLAEDAVNTPTAAKRGRPKKNKNPQPSPSTEEPNIKKRGRPRLEVVADKGAIGEDPELAQPDRKSRKAARITTNDVEGAAEEGESLQPADKSTRGRADRKTAQEANGEARVEDGSSPNNAAKKKRGRPPKVVEAPTEAQTEDPTEPEPAPKKKRGRPSLNKESVTKEPAEAAEDEPALKKRGRKPKAKSGDAEEPVPEEVAEVEPAPKKKRGRPSLNEGHVTKEPAETADEEPAPKKRGRKPKATVEEVEEPPEEEEPAAGKKKRGRPTIQTEPEAQEVSQSDLKEVRRRKGRPPSAIEEPVAEKPTKKRRKRSSQGEEEPSEPSPETQRRRPGRPRASDAASSPHAPEEQASKPRKSKKRPSGDDDITDPAPAKKRRRRTSEEIRQQQQQQQPRAEPATACRPAPKYRHIAPRARQIPRSTIEENWSPLAPPSLGHVSSLIRLAERPVLQRLAANEKRCDQAASAIRLVTKRLTKKLSRGLPFPPAAAPLTGSRSGKKRDTDGGRAEELNFERVIEDVAALERQLDPLLHAVKLLKAEKERDERALEADYESLTTLEANARSEARNYKDNLRKTHVLVPEKKVAAGAARRDAGGDEHDLKFVPDESVSGTLFKDLEDDELRGLAGQVGSHMESMRNNLQQIDGVVPQIVRSRAALQDVLFKHLDQQSYENVLFG
ncbi:CENP-Q, a CENPA-CAD centromere complex subunit-domain-containing protein [Colletotrichum cereale]|nr:CENP-Q, a CENPA-CAD centromere complex subunit-domain-containing protein [Colletotrichum cereale]